MKKFLTFLMLLSVSFGVQAQSLRVWMGDMEMTADGKTVTYMTVYMTDPDDQYSAFQMGITVPEGISINKVKSGRNMVDDARLNADRFDGLAHSLGVNMPNATTIKVTCIDLSANEVFYADDADGNIVEELFTIGLVGSPEMYNGEYTIEMWDLEMIHQNATGVKPVNTNLTAKLTVKGGKSSSVTIPYTLTACGVGTLILPFDAELPAGLQAYTCTGVVDNVLTLAGQTSIQAGTPLILLGEAGDYEFEGTPTATENSYTEGLLTGVMAATDVDNGYVLQTQGEVTGFYRMDKTLSIPAYRCYLNVESNIKAFVFSDDATAIEAITPSHNESVLYNLSGQRISKAQKGINIVGGKKVLK